MRVRIGGLGVVANKLLTAARSLGRESEEGVRIAREAMGQGCGQPPQQNAPDVNRVFHNHGTTQFISVLGSNPQRS